MATTQTDVKAKTVAGTGALGIGAAGLGTRIKGFYYSMSTGGTVALNDGSASGALLLSIVVPVGSNSCLIPGEGIRSTGDPFATFTTAVGSITFFYG